MDRTRSARATVHSSSCGLLMMRFSVPLWTPAIRRHPSAASSGSVSDHPNFALTPTASVAGAAGTSSGWALKSKNALWLQMGQVRLVGQGRSYFLRTGKAQKVPGGSYKILTNGYLPEGDGLGFLEVDLEYETGQ